MDLDIDKVPGQDSEGVMKKSEKVYSDNVSFYRAIKQTEMQGCQPIIPGLQKPGYQPDQMAWRSADLLLLLVPMLMLLFATEIAVAAAFVPAFCFFNCCNFYCRFDRTVYSGFSVSGSFFGELPQRKHLYRMHLYETRPSPVRQSCGTDTHHLPYPGYPGAWNGCRVP